ncbi:hypothetical protein DXG01_014254 [Tephrocybe rancida]|nr:hypothetical protein DXG01_014254 [Tephrocybe rancida]
MAEKAESPLSVQDKLSQSDASDLAQDLPVSRATLTRMDIRLMPVLAIMYLLSYLDRTNVGNARIAGLQADLKLTNTQVRIT